MSGAAKPRETLSIFDSIAIIVGIVVGVGIFRFPSIVASVSGSGAMLILFWFLGGLISFIGALCYAELTSTYPDAGGDYHFLRKSLGNVLSFLFAWSRMTVIQTGSIAVVAFIIGDYASEIFNLGAGSNVIYAIITVGILTLINVFGIKQGKRTQHILIVAIILGILAAIAFSIFLIPSVENPVSGNIMPTSAALGTAMIFVLFTYGGWNEAAYISAEVIDKSRNMIKVLLFSIATVTFIYLLVNFALIRGLGLEAMAESKAVVSDLMKSALGPNGARFISVLILIAALSTINATIITGARTNYALGRDFSILKYLGHWKEKGSTPVNGLLVQGAITVALILFGAVTKDGFRAMVDYTAPVFWFFFFMVGFSIFILRQRYPNTKRAFRVPFYPVTPIIFCLVCLYMLYSSLVYTSRGALLGIAVLLTGIPVLLLQRRKKEIILEG